MGYITHDALVVTCWKDSAAQHYIERAREIFPNHDIIAGPSASVTNGYSTFVITASGSKFGWPEADNHQSRLQAFCAVLREGEAEGLYAEWCWMKYGKDDAKAWCERSSWTRTDDPQPQEETRE